MRAWVAETAGKQPGDPARAARAIADEVARASGREAAPLRLPLGADAVDAIRKKLAFIGDDVDRTERVARATAFEGS